MIPVRRLKQQLEVCLIRRKGRDSWGIPKGFIDPGETSEETALKEAHEEAGLEGCIAGASVGTYTYEKWGAEFVVVVYVLEVQEELSKWQEMSVRERRWCSRQAAALLLADHPVEPLFDRALSEFLRRRV